MPGGKEGDHRATKEMTPQQAKMKKCNTDASAKSLKGYDRKKFMSECVTAS